MLVFLILTILCVPFYVVSAALTLNDKRCGSKSCNIFEYCSSFSTQCEHCAKVCELEAHNFDHEICLKQCQDYLHDVRYTSASNYSADIKRLEKQQTVLLVVSIVLLILFLLVHGTHLFRWLKRKDCLSLNVLKHKKKQVVRPTVTVANPHTQSPKLSMRRANGLNSVYSISGMEGATMRTVSTPISNRYPAEDTTLDYSYDNAALQVTPVSEKPKSETMF